MPSLLSDVSFPLVVEIRTTVATLLLVPPLRLPITITRCFYTSVVCVQPPFGTALGWRAFERNLMRFSHAISICHLCKYSVLLTEETRVSVENSWVTCKSTEIQPPYTSEEAGDTVDENYANVGPLKQSIKFIIVTMELVGTNRLGTLEKKKVFI